MALPQSPRLRQLRRFISQPSGIAALISIGFHGALFAAAPTLTSNALSLEPTATAPRQVPLIELTPEEQQQLPAFTRPGSQLPPGLESFEGLDITEDLDGSSGFGSNGGFDSFSPSPGSSGSTFTSPGSSIWALPPLQVLPPLGRPSSPARPIPQPSTTIDPERTDPERVGDGPESTPTAASTPETTPTPATPPPRATDELVAALLAPPEDAQGTTALNPEASPLEENAYSAEGTSPEAAEAARGAWQQRLAGEGQEPVEIAEVVELPVAYSRRICLTPEPTPGQVGLWLTPDIDEQPPLALLRSTGYAFLDRQILETVAGTIADLNDETLPRQSAVLFELPVTSEDCLTREEFMEKSTPAAEPEAEAPAPPAPSTPEAASPAEEPAE